MKYYSALLRSAVFFIITLEFLVIFLPFLSGSYISELEKRAVKNIAFNFNSAFYRYGYYFEVAKIFGFTLSCI